ncbi:hypothetical protein [Sphingosinicella sp. BN140058]|uniref:hypothetical protein n=1 Tax=Sphingosinicella sp. BN140058 TaxID=1892855 RepID=UPI00101294DE|nr:hypothetical protein [Sphingosinicella sp. BN140058]QAY75221.1 hypothetical protein ETR14_00750 [Sphingosinicella sp. BN140058]
MIIGFVAGTALALQAQPLPNIVIAPELQATDCGNPEARTQLLQQGDAALAGLEPLMQATNQIEARMDARGARLIALGKWTDADRKRFGERLLSDPAFAAHVAKTQQFSTSLMETLEAGFAPPQDDERSCRAILNMLDQISRNSAVVSEGWQLIDRAYSEEERRLDVAPAAQPIP